MYENRADFSETVVQAAVKKSKKDTPEKDLQTEMELPKAAPKDEDVSFVTVKELAAEAIKRGKREELAALLDKYEVSRVSELAEDDLFSFAAHARAL